jgi:hypothetical protein
MEEFLPSWPTNDHNTAFQLSLLQILQRLVGIVGRELFTRWEVVQASIKPTTRPYLFRYSVGQVAMLFAVYYLVVHGRGYKYWLEK